jgi:hypothetical protein
VCLVALCACAVIGNALVCASILSVHRLRRDHGNYLLAALAGADAAVGLVVMPPAIVYMISGIAHANELALRRSLDIGRVAVPPVDDG